MYNDVTEQNLKTYICTIIIGVFALTKNKTTKKKPSKTFKLKNLMTYDRISTTGLSPVPDKTKKQMHEISLSCRLK